MIFNIHTEIYLICMNSIVGGKSRGGLVKLAKTSGLIVKSGERETKSGVEGEGEEHREGGEKTERE